MNYNYIGDRLHNCVAKMVSSATVIRDNLISVTWCDFTEMTQ